MKIKNRRGPKIDPCGTPCVSTCKGARINAFLKLLKCVTSPSDGKLKQTVAT